MYVKYYIISFIILKQIRAKNKKILLFGTRIYILLVNIVLLPILEHTYITGNDT